MKKFLASALRGLRPACLSLLAPALLAGANSAAAQSGVSLVDGTQTVTITAKVADAYVPGKGTIKGFYPYDVRGPGMAAGGPLGLMPPVIAAQRGRTLTIDFINQLPEEANLHTHGLAITPVGVGFGIPEPRPQYGECILVNGAANGASPAPGGLATSDPCKPQGNAPASIAGEAQPIRYRDVIPSTHPAGLYWYHPHVHHNAEPQLLAGLSGLLTIGDIWDYAYFNCWAGEGFPPAGAKVCGSLSAGLHERAQERAADVRFIGLKDIQIDQDGGGAWSLHDPRDYQKDRCGAVTLDDSLPPELRRKAKLVFAPGAGVAPGACWSVSPKNQWVFTVAGEVFPTLTAPPGAIQIWRLANMSADLTYRLRVETPDEAAPHCLGSRADLEKSKQRHCLSLKLMSRDGVPVDSTSSATRATEITLMPSARVEAYIPRCDGRSGSKSEKDGCLPTDRQLEAKLVTAGVSVGDKFGGADVWPPIDLARVVGEPGPAAESQLRSVGYAPPQLARAESAPAEAKSLAPEPAQAIGPSDAKMCDPKKAHYPVDATSFPLSSNRVRLVRFNNLADFTTDPAERFGLHVQNFNLHHDVTGKNITVRELLDKAAGGDKLAHVNLNDPCQGAAIEDKTGAAFDFYYPAFMGHGGHGGGALVHSWRSDAPEYWLLINDSGECHNFHIHQTKFEVVASSLKRGPGGDTEDQCLGDRDPNKLASHAALHDNFPLPPGARMLVRVAFGREQLGRFVFHCHILEHEDAGMMTLLQVEERAPH